MKKIMITFILLGITSIQCSADDLNKLIDEKVKSITQKDGIVKITEYIGLLFEKENITNILPNTVLSDKYVTIINIYPSGKQCSWENYYDCAETKNYISIKQNEKEVLNFNSGRFSTSYLENSTALLFHKFGYDHWNGLTVYHISENSITCISDYFGEDSIRLVDVDHDGIDEVNLVSCGYSIGALYTSAWTSLVYSFNGSNYSFSDELTRKYNEKELFPGSVQCDFEDDDLDEQCQTVMNSIILNTSLNNFNIVKKIIENNITFKDKNAENVFLVDYADWCFNCEKLVEVIKPKTKKELLSIIK